MIDKSISVSVSPGFFFVPFLGAFVLHGKLIDSSRESAFVALSGPILGIIASLKTPRSRIT